MKYRQCFQCSKELPFPPVAVLLDALSVVR